MLGYQDDARYRPETHRHTSRLRGIEVDIVRQRTEALDEAQLFAGGDHLSVNLARSLADEKLSFGQVLQHLPSGRFAQHSHVQLRRRRRQRCLLMA